MNLPIIAVVCPDTRADADIRILWQTAERLRRHGLRVGGVLNKIGGDGRVVRETTRSIGDGREFSIMQDLGGESSSCKLDPNGLADSASVLRGALDGEILPHVLFFNKFGIAEAQGRGLQNEMAEAVSHGIYAVSPVRQKYLADWRAFSGGCGTELAAGQLFDYLTSRIKTG